MENDSCGTNDGEIVRQVIAGDVNAFEHLLEKYQNLVLRIVKKHAPHDQVKDLTQEVFIRTYQSSPFMREAGREKPGKSWIGL
jgi:RNA polymerase sigma-70 factor (ECF subfamily)